MANIDLKRFVDINIKRHVDSQLIGTRDTVVLYSSAGTTGTTNLVTSLTQAASLYGTSGSTPDATTYAYLEVFFNNSGAKVLVVEGYGYDELTADVIASLENKYILIACAIPSTNAAAGYTAMKTLATTRAGDSTIYGINEKCIIARTTTVDETSVKNFIAKYSNTLGAEMTIAAYLSKINVYKQDVVYDYMYTQEVLAAETLDDSTYESIITANMNVDIDLANSIRNCGGNCKDGADVTNNYVRIILHQTLTEQLINLLTEKIKGSAGISKIYNTIAQELNNYLTCGYLTTDKIWIDDDLTVTYNGEQYTIITKGTPLTNGYIVKVLPFTSLTDTDKAARKAPPIYVVIADQYTIRTITINGEVI